jgi:hypothetical protein
MKAKKIFGSCCCFNMESKTDLIKELTFTRCLRYIFTRIKRGYAYAGIRKKIDYWFVHFMLKALPKKIKINFY